MKQNKYFLSLMSGVMLLGVACAKDIDKNKIGKAKDKKVAEKKSEAENKENLSVQDNDSTLAKNDESKKQQLVRYKMPIVTNYKLAREIEQSLNKESAEKVSKLVLDSLVSSLTALDKPADLISEMRCEFVVLDLDQGSSKESIQFSDKAAKESSELKTLSPYLLSRDKTNQNLIDIYLLDNKLDSSIPYDMRLGIECVGGGEIVEFKLRSFIDGNDSIRITKDTVKSIEFKGTDITDLNTQEANEKVKESYLSAKDLLEDSYTGYTEFVNMPKLPYSQIMSLMQFSGKMKPKYDAGIPNKEVQCTVIENDLEIAEDRAHQKEIERLTSELEICVSELREMKGLDADNNDLLKQYKSDVSIQIEEPTRLTALVRLDWASVNLYSEKSHREILDTTDANILRSLQEAQKDQAAPADYVAPKFEESNFLNSLNLLDAVGHVWEKINSINIKSPTPYGTGRAHNTF